MKETIVAGKRENANDYDFYIKVFMHDDGHFGLCSFVKNSGCSCHFMIKDKSKYDELVNCLKNDFKNIDNPLNFNEVDKEINNVIDKYFDKYLEEYPEPEEPQMRTEEEIGEYMDEAWDRVWLVRKQDMFANIALGRETVPSDILDQCRVVIKEVCKKYNIDFNEPVSDWDYGYWSGILAALRWVTGDEKDCLDT